MTTIEITAARVEAEAMDDEELLDYAVSVIGWDDIDEELTRSYPHAIAIVRLYSDGFIDAFGITKDGHEQLRDLYEYFEGEED